MKTVRENLQEARDLIADPAKWTQGSWARTSDGRTIGSLEKNAVCFCSLGALARTLGCQPIYTQEFRHLTSAANEIFAGREVVQVNDELGHEASLRMFDRAIERAPA